MSPEAKVMELREAMEAVLRRALNRHGMNTQELRGLLWRIEEIAQKALELTKGDL